jgi:sortase A
MKKLLQFIMTLAVCASLTIPVFASEYAFDSGPDSGTVFGRGTSTDKLISADPMNENVRRNKDNSDLPPPYFFGSGDIPTDPSSLYHENLVESEFAPLGQQYPQTGGEEYAPGSGGVTVLPSTSQTAVDQMPPSFYEDGSIGTIYVDRTGKNIKVYEGENTDNFKKGAGHFVSTDAWNGNVALAGHNRGSWPFFSFIKDLKIGDRITYTTVYGTRTYEVYLKERVSETDRSKLE